MSEVRRTAIQSRSGYKSKITRVKKIIEKYEADSSLLTLRTALPEIEHNLNLLPDLRKNFEGVQEFIVQLTEDQGERDRELNDLEQMLDDLDKYEAKLLELRVKAKLDIPETESVKGMFEFLNARMDEQQIQQEVERRMSESRHKEEREAEQKKFEATLHLMISNNSIRASTPTDPHPSHGFMNTQIKIKGLSVPEFGGDYKEWMSFKDLFTAIIDKNTTMSDSYKMYTMCTHLKDEAKTLVAHLPVTDDNYKVAWKLLMDRYDDKMGIATSHIRMFLNIPKMSEPSADAMRRTHTTVVSTVQALDALHMEQRDIWLIHLTLEKLDAESKVLWSRASYKKTPTWAEFTSFLTERYKTMELAGSGHPEKTNKKPEMKSKQSKSSAPKWSSNLAATTTSQQNSAASQAPCACCGKTNHRTVKCFKFRGLQDAQRFEIVQQAKLCVNCLDSTHQVDNCSSSACKKCGEKHSTWLHFAIHPDPQPRPSVSTNFASVTTKETTDNPDPDKATLNCTTSLVPNILLATAVIQVQDVNGEKIMCRAVLDSGSQANIITEKLCQLLKLPKRKSNCRLEGIGAQEAPARFMVSLSFGPRGFNTWTSTECFVQQRITGRHPVAEVRASTISIPPKLVLADPQWFVPQPIDILIGGQHYWELIMDQTIRLGPGLPVLKQSKFGWLVVGEIAQKPANQLVSQSCNLTTFESIDSTLKRFWELEEVAGPAQRKGEDENAEKIYRETVSRDPSGRFIVHLPFKDNVDQLASNKSNASRQLFFLERKLNASPTMRAKYEEIFGEYLSLGIIERVPKEELGNKAYFLPYHGVYKESSTTTKLRIVFNASSKSKTSLSLNDTLLTGPQVQPPLIETLWRFRLHRCALTCDITKMYLQFLVTPEQRDFQRFLWRTHKMGAVEEYRFRTLCFGVGPSPFLATRSLVQLALESGDKFPAARDALVTSFYVDDCLVSADSVDKLQQIRKELTELLASAGLQLSKWTSNVPNLCNSEESKEFTAGEAASDPVSALGLYWTPGSDQLSYKSQKGLDQLSPTMRMVLSTFARIFDPLGLLGPVVINAKCIMQALWKLKCGWDDPIPDSVMTDWRSFISSIEFIPSIRVPRWISEFPQVANREIHVFTDASMRAYGAAVYVVTGDSSGARSSHLLTAKSRVAPIKTATIPKLELCAATLGSKLLRAVCTSLQCDSYFCWTDATIVLYQIRSPSGREQFVRNRVAEILQNTSMDNWGHVPTAQNPADIISRGVSAEQLSDSTLWWRGPDWLLESPDHWPKQPEDRSVLAVATVWTGTREYLIQKSNSFSYIRRILAWVLRFTTNLRNKGQHTGPLQPEEIQRAEIVLVKLEQRELLAEDIKTLSGAGQRQLSKQLRSLGAFLDNDGVIRVGGRLEYANIEESARQPMILPSGPLARLILNHEHLRLWHAGPTLIMMGFRRKFWPLFGRKVVRGIFARCVTCAKNNPRRCQQLMGQLPAPRVNLTKPFDVTGVDFAGPVLVKSNKLRKTPVIKTYIAVYVCMAVKAIHLEVVGDLTTDAFMASFRRFAARRGTPTSMYSDNGTNFVGAATQIHRFLANSHNRETIVDATSGEGITWHFIPPRAPHWGGLWEASVKAMKHHLTRVIGDSVLTYEELTTVITQIEGVLNTRPLTAVPDTTADPVVLTPAHFLMTAPITNLPDWNLDQISRLDRWQFTQKLYQDISKRWKREYLVTLQRRTKWDKDKPNLQLGDIVLLLDGVTPGTTWPLARIVDVHPGRDGKVRLVTIRTSKGTYKRPIQVLAKLPIETGESETGGRLSPGSVLAPNADE